MIDDPAFPSALARTSRATAPWRAAIDLRQIAAIARRNIIPIAVIVAIALLLGLIKTILTTPRYIATASVQIDQVAARVLNTDDVQPAAAYVDADRFLQTQTDVLSSRVMAMRVAQKLRLVGSPTFFAAMEVGTPEGSPAVLKQATLDVLEANLTIRLKRNSRVATISFSSPDPQLAALIANTYATEFIAGNLQRKYDSSSYAREFLADQLAATKQRLEESERQLNIYARQNGLIKTSETSGNGTLVGPRSVTTASLLQVNAAANEAYTARVAAEQKWRAVAETPLMSIPDVLSNQAIQALFARRAEANATLEEVSTRHRDDYPTVVQARAQVAELNQQIESLARNIRTAIHDQYAVALEQEQSLARQVAMLKGETLGEQDRSVRYNILAREADTNRSLYEGLLQRYKEVSAQAGVTTNNISIVDQADPPLGPSSPNLSINMLLSLLAGLTLAGLFVVVREQVDDAVRAPDDIERKLEMPVLGVIPLVSDASDILDDLQDPKSPIAEAYHALRTSLLYSTTSGLPRMLVVTSTQATEGKSTTSYAVAADLAALGRRTLLIDVDLRRPSLHKLIGVANEPGMSNLLTRQAELKSAIRSTSVENLSFIASGAIPPNPTVLLGSPALAEILKALRDMFDVVVLDGPPVLGLADAPILAAQADATVFVVASSRGHRGATKSALRRLQNMRANIIGAVLTKFSANKVGYGYAYGYDYYSYGSSRKTADADA